MKKKHRESDACNLMNELITLRRQQVENQRKTDKEYQLDKIVLKQRQYKYGIEEVQPIDVTKCGGYNVVTGESNQKSSTKDDDIED